MIIVKEIKDIFCNLDKELKDFNSINFEKNKENNLTFISASRLKGLMKNYIEKEDFKMNYIIKSEKTKVNVKDLKIEYLEKRAFDKNTGEEIYIREIEIENDINLYDIYKKEKGLLTSFEIKNIRNKYDLSQKDFSLLLGFGEITIHRYENGSIQTEANNYIIKQSENPENMQEIVINNSSKIEKETYNKLFEKIQELIQLKEHKIVILKKEDIEELNFKTEDVLNVSKKIIEEYNNQLDKISTELTKITQITLQKMLYYVQGLSLVIFNKKAFNENIFAWDYGPVVREAYDTYKIYGKNEIIISEKINLSKGLEKIINLVIEFYGKFSPAKLINLTHEENPWKNTIKNEVINEEDIKLYFKKVYFN